MVQQAMALSLGEPRNGANTGVSAQPNASSMPSSAAEAARAAAAVHRSERAFTGAAPQTHLSVLDRRHDRNSRSLSVTPSSSPSQSRPTSATPGNGIIVGSTSASHDVSGVEQMLNSKLPVVETPPAGSLLLAETREGAAGGWGGGNLMICRLERDVSTPLDALQTIGEPAQPGQVSSRQMITQDQPISASVSVGLPPLTGSSKWTAANQQLPSPFGEIVARNGDGWHALSPITAPQQAVAVQRVQRRLTALRREPKEAAERLDQRSEQRSEETSAPGALHEENQWHQQISSGPGVTMDEFPHPVSLLDVIPLARGQIPPSVGGCSLASSPASAAFDGLSAQQQNNLAPSAFATVPALSTPEALPTSAAALSHCDGKAAAGEDAESSSYTDQSKAQQNGIAANPFLDDVTQMTIGDFARSWALANTAAPAEGSSRQAEAFDIDDGRSSDHSGMQWHDAHE